MVVPSQTLVLELWQQKRQGTCSLGCFLGDRQVKRCSSFALLALSAWNFCVGLRVKGAKEMIVICAGKLWTEQTQDTATEVCEERGGKPGSVPVGLCGLGMEDRLDPKTQNLPVRKEGGEATPYLLASPSVTNNDLVVLRVTRKKIGEVKNQIAKEKIGHLEEQFPDVSVNLGMTQTGWSHGASSPILMLRRNGELSKGPGAQERTQHFGRGMFF